MKRSSLTAMFIFILFSAQSYAQTAPAILPDFTFYKLDNSPFTNKNLATGKKLFFVFFDTGCDHCQRTITYFNQHEKDLGNAAVYLISMDNIIKINEFMNKYAKDLEVKKNVTVLQDMKYEFIRKFNPKKYPSMFLYASDKRLLLYDDDEKNASKFIQQINAGIKK